MTVNTEHLNNISSSEVSERKGKTPVGGTSSTNRPDDCIQLTGALLELPDGRGGLYEWSVSIQFVIKSESSHPHEPFFVA